MTRINLVDPATLHYKHLVAELHELPRVFTLVRKSHSKIPENAPEEYTLGKGHVKFFYNKLNFLADRYELLCNEMRSRSYYVNQIPRPSLLENIDVRMLGNYEPTGKAVEINQQRIDERVREWETKQYEAKLSKIT